MCLRPVLYSLFAGLHSAQVRYCLLLWQFCRRQKKLTEYEKWEYKQLMMSGVLDVREFPLFDEENGMGVLAQVDEVRMVAAHCLLRCCDTHCNMLPVQYASAGAGARLKHAQHSPGSQC